MSKIPMPSTERLPPGPFRTLVEELHTLHESAGSPGLRSIERRIKRDGHPDESVSYESVRTMLHGAALAKWEKWDLVVRCLASLAVGSKRDPETEAGRFQLLWTAANKEPSGTPFTRVFIAPSGSAPLGSERQVDPALDGPAEARPDDSAEAQDDADSDARSGAADERFSARLDFVDEAEIERARELEIAAADNLARRRATDAAILVAATPSTARHNIIMVAVFAVFGTLVGGIAGTLVTTLNGAVGSARWGAVIGPSVGLFVGLFAGVVIGGVGAGVGRLIPVGEGFVGLVGLGGVGGLIGLFVGTIVSSQTRAATPSLLTGCGAGLVAGCVIGAIVLLGLLIRDATARLENTEAGDGE